MVAETGFSFQFLHYQKVNSCNRRLILHTQFLSGQESFLCEECFNQNVCLDPCIPKIATEYIIWCVAWHTTNLSTYFMLYKNDWCCTNFVYTNKMIVWKHNNDLNITYRRKNFLALVVCSPVCDVLKIKGACL